ncbi:MAG: RNA polymerase sigma-70 factor [Bacteroidetes bacterium]|nr:RNA polymerase sigma-70 factor [Bacteroidota bacterium]MBS1930279.1 RNA polymerase sigma-70 factor [Bacteroidota bacterium]
MRTTDKIKLLQQAIACFDDAQAYKELFLFFQPSLEAFAFSIIRSRELSEEIVSDVFMKIWEKRHSLDKVENLKFYLFTAVKNRALNKIHEQKRISTLSIDDAPVELNSFYQDPEQQLISAEMIKQLNEIVDQLPPRCKLIFKLVKEDELTYKEVAELLHLSVKTIENQMTLAFKKIGVAIHFLLYHPVSSYSDN